MAFIGWVQGLGFNRMIYWDTGKENGDYCSKCGVILG